MHNKLSLSELNDLIKDALLDAFPETVWIVAEISELKENRSGHCYLDLIEKNDLSNEIVARTRATIWSYVFRMLKPYFETTTGQLFSSGIKVLIQATVEFHPSFGLSLNIKDIDPTYTIGDLARQRNEIIKRLKSEGVFDMNKELALPLVPQNIAVISSATAAGYLDFINQLDHNSYGFVFNCKLFEAYMQGAESVPSIIRSLEKIYLYEDFFDAVVIIRGGGAQADLNSFDSYELAINITQFPLPVITGIGHEKDDTIIDLVAHSRLKTPTAVAEFLIAGAAGFYENLITLETLFSSKVKTILENETNYLNTLGKGISNSGQLYLLGKKALLSSIGQKFQKNVKQFSFQKIKQLIDFEKSASSSSALFLLNSKNKLKQLENNIENVSELLLLKEENSVQYLNARFTNSVHNFIQREYSAIHLTERSVELLNPDNIIKRGYTLTYKDGKILKSASNLNENDKIETRFSDGIVKSKIIKNNSNGN
jgi:exodeoxyribonuclease VII large subunit